MTPSFRSLTAGLALTLALPATAFANGMSASMIQENLIGKRMEAVRNGADLTVLFDDAGNVQMTGSDGVSNGTWTLSDNSFCITMTSGPITDDGCMTISSYGGGVYSTSTGISLTVVGR